MRVLVLGAGLAGVTAAHFLARDGHQVEVVDRQSQAASETSFANAGMITPGHAFPWGNPNAPKVLLRSLFKGDQALRLKLVPDPQMWRWGLKFLAECTEWVAQKLVRFTPLEHPLSLRGVVTVVLSLN